MARTEADVAAAPIVELEHADVPAACALNAEAGWNQTADDWSGLIALGRGFGIHADGAGLVATATAFPYPSGFGWIGMVLVHTPFRRRGLASRLMERAIDELRARGLVPFLDATPAGQPVYERMGFRPVAALARWRGKGSGGQPPDAVRPLADVGQVAELDLAAFGADRSALLEALARREGALALHDPAGGYLLARPGRKAAYVGPLVAREPAVAVRLLESALARVSGPVYVDVPDAQDTVREALARLGFEAERPFTRMALEHDTAFGDPTLVHAIAAPELG